MTISTLSGVPYGPTPRAAAYASALAQPPRLIVIHDTSNDGTKEQEAHYAATRGDDRSHWTSAHFYIDVGGPLGSLHLDKQAWAAYSYANSHGWHLEMCGYNTGMTKAVPPTTIAITAALSRRLADAAGIPLVKLGPADVAAGKRGICGHWDITQGLDVGSHDDPGPKFDWPAFMAAVTGGDDMSFFDEVQYRNRTGEQLITDLWYTAVDPAGLTRAALTEIRANLVAMLGKDYVDEQAIVDGVLAGFATLSADAIAEKLAALLGPELGAQVVAALGAKLTTPTA